MTMSGKMTAAALSAVLFGLVCAGRTVEARKLPQDLAAKLSGTWVLNRDMSTGFGAPGRGRGGTPSAFAEATADKSPGLRRPGPLFATVAAAQKGARGGLSTPSDATDLTPEQRAEQAAMRQLQQIDEHITIKASAEAVTFVDARGERTYAINDKNVTIDVGGSSVKVRSKWDKRVLRQEFNNTQAKLVQTWGLDDADHLVLTAKVESLTMGVGASADRVTTLVTPDRKAVFDRR
jgi:hypothetical protein